MLGEKIGPRRRTWELRATVEIKRKKLDPLFQLFEHFLFTRSYDDSAKFTRELATEYVSYLDSTPAHVPYYVRSSVLEDLESEVHEMLIKKMYGCVNDTDYENSGKVVQITEQEIEAFDFTPTEKADQPKIKN